MASGRRNQTGDDTDQIVMHVAWVSQSSCASAHDRADELIRLLKGRLLDMKGVRCNARESAIVEDYDRVGVLRQALESEKRVVRLDHDVAGVLSIREDRVRLDQFLWKPIIQPLQQERSETRSSASRNGVEQHETLQFRSAHLFQPSTMALDTHLQTVASIRFPINHIQHLILHSISHSITRRPIVSRARSFLVHIEVLRIVNVAIGPVCDTVYDSRFEIEHDRARHIARVVGLVEEDIFAIAASMRAFGGIRV